MVSRSPTRADIVIVGAGPAGSYLAYLLAKEGLKPIIFDHSHPREKPCGGGVSSFALGKYQILQEVKHLGDLGIKLKIISPKGEEAVIFGKKECLSISREVLDQHLLKKAISKGAVLIPERVISIERTRGGFLIITEKSTTFCEIIIGADGVNSLVRKTFVNPIGKENLAIVVGYFGSCSPDDVEIFKYYKEFPGYAYFFKRKTDCSLGIGTGLIEAETIDLRGYLTKFIKEYYPQIKLKKFWSALIPQISDPKFFDLPCAGDNWALIGDAAGHVDSITGEGILYAIWSAELLAKAIMHGSIKKFDELWQEEYGEELRHKAKELDKSYDPVLLERMVRMAKRSKTFGTIVHEYMMHEIPAKKLNRAIISRSPRILWDIIGKKWV